MARIAGVNVPENKHIEISLTHIFGIGRKTAQNICAELKIDYTRKISDLSEEEIENIENSLKVNFGSNLKLKFSYDPNLLGGLIVQVGSIMIDTSLKSKLQQIENKMIEA